LKVLVVGSGAREHTLVWKIAQSPKVKEVFVAPGNGGTAQMATNLNIKATDFEVIGNVVREKHIDLVVVGPEDPLSSGIVDHLTRLGIPVFGPTRAAAQLEASKVFSKELMQKYNIPCAQSVSFTDFNRAKEYILSKGAPLVVKADGLAAGKGVVVTETLSEAIDALTSIMESRVFGSAGDKVVIEEKLIGTEMSAFVFTDGKAIVSTVPACDYKRVYDSDHGPNTGGMGSYSPPFFYTETLGEKIRTNIIEPTLKAMEKENRKYQGALYAGLMVNTPQADSPKVIEFNVRLGDPECQVVLPRLKSDLMDIILGVVNGNLQKVRPVWSDEPCVGVVMASGGYPGTYKTGFPITGLQDLDKDIVVFHAGTKTGEKPGQVLTCGGRILTVVARGKTLNEAREKVYANITRINFEGCHYRHDIARFGEVPGS
jgi:phosphoribosylamine---glycine ligase